MDQSIEMSLKKQSNLRKNAGKNLELVWCGVVRIWCGVVKHPFSFFRFSSPQRDVFSEDKFQIIIIMHYGLPDPYLTSSDAQKCCKKSPLT